MSHDWGRSKHDFKSNEAEIRRLLETHPTRRAAYVAAVEGDLFHGSAGTFYYWVRNMPPEDVSEPASDRAPSNAAPASLSPSFDQAAPTVPAAAPASASRPQRLTFNPVPKDLV